MNWLIRVACLLLIAKASFAQVEVSLQALNLQDKSWASLRIYVKNVGTTPVTKPKVAYELAVPSGQIPVAEAWGTGTVNVSVEKITDTKWYVWLSLDQDLEAGKEWNWDNGALIGVHVGNHMQWDYAASPSFDGNAGTKVLNHKIKAWDGTGRLIWGAIADMAPPASPAGESSVAVSVGTGGRCNVVGTVTLVPTDRLDFWCQEDATHQRPQVWVDGVLQAADKYPTLLPDGKNHTIQASFSSKPSYPVQVIVNGNGRCVPQGTGTGYAGDTAWIGCEANDGAILQSLTVNGEQKTATPFLSLPNLDGARYVTANFVSSTGMGQSLEMTAKREIGSTAQFAVFRLQAKNTGSASLASGWKFQIPFRAPDGVKPIVNSWDCPGLNSSLISLGQGWWIVEFASTETVAVGSYAGYGRGYYFALSIDRISFNWDVTGDVALPASGSEYAPIPYVRAFGKDGSLLAGKEWLMTSTRAIRPAVVIEYKDEANGKEMARPRIILKNTGVSSLSNFSYEFYFCTENGRVPQLNNWYGVAKEVQIFALGGHCYSLRYAFPDVTVAPGSDLPNPAGNSLGLYYSDYSVWDYSNDWSHIHGTSNFMENPRIPVFDRWGNRIYGTLWTDPGSPGANGASGSSGSSAVNADGSPAQSSDLVQKKDLPIFSRQPVDVTVDQDGSATFEARAFANGTDLQYQWRLNGVALVGATNPVLVLDRVGAAQDGDELVCVARTSTGSTLSRTAILHVKKIPKALQMLVPPKNDTVALGGTAHFAVFAVGDEPLTYQWFKGSAPLQGQNDAEFSLTIASPADTASRYWVRVKDAHGKLLESSPVFVVLQKNGRGAMQISLGGKFSTEEAQNADFVDLKFRLFSQNEGGDPLWSEAHPAVALKSGEWTTALGYADPEGLAVTVASQSTLYLEIVLDAGIPRVLGPRLALTTAPFALQGGKRLVLGKGVPDRVDLPIGTLWLDADQAKTWIRDDSAWKALEK